jgi:formylglycine-generating enzyme
MAQSGNRLVNFAVTHLLIVVAASSTAQFALAREGRKSNADAAMSAPGRIEIPPRSVYPDITVHEPPIDWRTLKQPTQLVEDLKALQTGTQADRIAALKAKLAHDMVFVEGGEFWMGDFGQYQNTDGLPWTPARFFNKPVHKTKVESFSLSRYKVTYAELDFFNDVHKRPMAVPKVGFENRRRPDLPAGADWKEAREYCKWWGKLAGQVVDLTTEPQWEYAARNRGAFVLFATDNGKLDLNRNVAWDRTLEDFGWESDVPLPIALYPSSPLGLFDMGTNGNEWMRDPVDVTRLPLAERLRNEIRGPYVMRGTDRVSESGYGSAVVDRLLEKPTTTSETLRWASYSATFRCALFSPRQLPQAKPTGSTGPGSNPPIAK